jgi:hypothetical protein
MRVCDVVKRDRKELSDVHVVERVEDVASVFSVPNEILVAKNTKLMRHHRLLQREFVAEFVDAAFLVENRSNESHPCRVGNGFERTGNPQRPDLV